MFRSKVLATIEETEEIMELHRKATTTPVIKVGTYMGGHDEWKNLVERLEEMATAHGLEPQAGEWGFDIETRQFLSSFPISGNQE